MTAKGSVIMCRSVPQMMQLDEIMVLGRKRHLPKALHRLFAMPMRRARGQTAKSTRAHSHCSS